MLSQLLFRFGPGGKVWRAYRRTERRYIDDVFAAEAADPALKAEHDQVRHDRVAGTRIAEQNLALSLNRPFGPPDDPKVIAENRRRNLEASRLRLRDMSAPVRVRDCGDNYTRFPIRPAWLPDADEKAEIARMIHESLALEPIRRPAPTLRFTTYYGFIVADPDMEWSIDTQAIEELTELDWPKHPPKNDQQWSLTVSHVWNGLRRWSEGYWGLGFHGFETVWPDPDNQLERFLIDAAHRHGYTRQLNLFGVDEQPHLGGIYVPPDDWEKNEYVRMDEEWYEYAEVRTQKFNV